MLIKHYDTYKKILSLNLLNKLTILQFCHTFNITNEFRIILNQLANVNAYLKHGERLLEFFIF